MRFLLASSVAVVLLLAPTDPAAAERNRWEQRGPSAASVTRIVQAPSSDAIAYCVANGGVYETLDGGRRWVSRTTKIGDPALDGLAIYDVALLRSEPRVLLAATATDVVFKSTDGGQSWFVRRTGSLGGIPRIIRREAEPRRLVLLVFQALLESLDEGETWMPLSVATPDFPTAVDMDPTTGALIAASAGGVFRLEEGGSSWTRLSGAFESGTAVELKIQPSQPNIVYVITQASNFPRIFRSADGGRSWTAAPLEIGTPAVTPPLVADGRQPDRLYASVDGRLGRSDDGGMSWRFDDDGLAMDGEILRFQSLAVGADRMYAGTDAGLFMRGASAATWTPMNDGLAGLSVRAVAADASFAGGVYAATDPPGGIYRVGAAVWSSRDAGSTWSFGPDSVLYEGSSAVASDPVVSGTAYLGTTSCSPREPYSCAGNLYRTTDGGSHWQRLAEGVGGVISIAVDPRRLRTVYAVGFVQEFGVFRSEDAGASWQPLTNGAPNDVMKVLVDARLPDTVFAVSAAHGVFRSSDGGASWQATTLAVSVAALAQDFRRGSLYAGTSDGLWTSQDVGNTWTFRASPGGIRALAADGRGGKLYAARGGAGVQESSDGGATWSTIGSGLLGIAVTDLAVSAGGSILYAATDRGTYVFQSRSPRALPPR